MNILNKKKLIKYIFLFILFFLPLFVFGAEEPLDAFQQKFALGPVLQTLFTSLTEPFKTVFVANIAKSRAGLAPLFQALIYIYIMYELAKTYMEGRYNEIPVKICTLSFKFIAVGTFLGVLGAKQMYFFSIPAELISKATGQAQSVFDWSSTTPVTALAELIKSIYLPWDNSAAVLTAQMFKDFSVAWADNSWWDVMGFLPVIALLIVALIATVILIIGYLLITFGAIGVILKAIEITIAIPVVVLFLAGKAIGIGEQYFNISMKYIIASMMDMAIVLLITKLSATLFTGIDMTTIFGLLLGLFVCVFYVLLLKIAPKIGTGILSGRPGVSMSDATQVLSIATVGGAMVGAVAGTAIGAGAGAIAAQKAGGSMLAGAAKGGASAAKNSGSNLAASANKALS